MNEKGISLSILVITIIIMAIITSATLYVGMDSIRNVKMQRFETDFKIIQTKCNELLKAGWSQDDFLVQGKRIEEVSSSKKREKITNAILAVTNKSNTENYIYYNKKGLENLGIVEIDREIVINITEKIIIDINGEKDNSDNIIYSIKWTGYPTNKNINRKWNSRFWKYY